MDTLERLIPVASEFFDLERPSGKVHYRLVAHPHGRHGRPMQEPDRAESSAAVSFDYFLHRRPREFTGGQLRIFDVALGDGRAAYASSFRDIHPVHDTLILYPASAWREVILVHCPSEYPSDGRFSLRGWIE